MNALKRGIFAYAEEFYFHRENSKKKLSRKYPIQGHNKNLCIHIYKEFFNYVEWNFMSTFLAKISINIHMNLILNRSLSIVPTMFCLVTIYYPPKKSSDFFKSRLHRKNSLLICCILLCHNF